MSATHSMAVLAALVSMLVPATAQARDRTVPRGFFGVMADGPVTDGTVTPESQFRAMRRAGVETVRVVFDWAAAEPYASPDLVPTDFTATDRIVSAAAAAGLQVLPVLIRAPAWAADLPLVYGSPPRRPEAFAAYARAMVARYGTGGTFWQAHPGQPIRAWQVWNEPTLDYYWTASPWPSTYVALLRATATAIRAQDPGAEVVLAGLTSGGNTTAWDALGQLYDAGARGWFDAVALHPYTATPAGVLQTVRLARGVMRAHGDRRPVWITETSWSSAGAKLSDPRVTWNTSEVGQAVAVGRVMRAVAKHRRRLGIERLVWYTWLSPWAGPGADWTRWAGLNRLAGDIVVAKPAVRVFRRVALRLEGR